ncbi:hypothetical protein HPB50_028498 [Hyalomma asiaticum]|nr:hypothetical protein HPB50_028498 [Hyalomma asiaticum]
MTQVFTLLLVALWELIHVHSADLHSWLYVLPTRLFIKTGTDLLSSLQMKIQKILSKIRLFGFRLSMALSSRAPPGVHQRAPSRSCTFKDTEVYTSAGQDIAIVCRTGNAAEEAGEVCLSVVAVLPVGDIHVHPRDAQNFNGATIRSADRYRSLSVFILRI